MELTNSRIITYPSIVTKSANHTVVLIDTSEQDIENVALFLGASAHNYDVYLYQNDQSDLQWLSGITANADRVVIEQSSTVTVQNSSAVIVGSDQQYQTALDYFQEKDLQGQL